MITNKDIRVENGSLIINGDPYPLDGQSPEAIMKIVKDNSDTTPTENSDAPITSGGVYAADKAISDTIGDITQTGVTGASVAAQLTELAGDVSGIEGQIGDKHFVIKTQEFTAVDISTPWGGWYVTVVLSVNYSDLALKNPPSAVLLSVKSETTTFLIMQIGSNAVKTDFYLVRPNSSTGVDFTIDALVIY